MNKCFQLCIIPISIFAFATMDVCAQEIDDDSYRSIVEALQTHMQNNPSVFPLEAFTSGNQSVVEGLKHVYFAYGERRFPTRTDFHPAMDVAYQPLKVGYVTTPEGQTKEVRSPQTYQKVVYAIQDGLLESIQLIESGYKIILKHTLDEPYYDSEGLEYFDYWTCYRHLHPRSLTYLSGIAKRSTGNPSATYEDLIGEHVFQAGDPIAFAGFPPDTTTLSRAHLDFSLNLYRDPDSGFSIRNYAVDPLLLFPPFEYADPYSHQTATSGVPAYQITVDNETLVTPIEETDGRFLIEIHAGGLSAGGDFDPVRYFALNAMGVTVFNDGELLGDFVVNRAQKLGYDTSSYDSLDNADKTIPHFDPPLGEQEDVYRMNAVLPTQWLDELGYDWSKGGSIEITLSSIWDEYLGGHSHSFDISLIPSPP